MRLTVITPVLNEEFFMPLFLESVTSYADEIIIVDGGSSDKTVDCIKSYQDLSKIKLFIRPQTGMPYSDDWNECDVWNFMIDQAKGDWILSLCADEIMDDRFKHVLPELMASTEHNLYAFPIINFWRDPSTIRINAPNDERWSNNILRMWRNHVGIRTDDSRHHTNLIWNGKSIWEFPFHVVNDIFLYHYHYALGKRIKYNDNRRCDVNMWDNTGEPDWNYHHEWYDIVLQPFTGTHPTVIQKYLQSQ